MRSELWIATWPDYTHEEGGVWVADVLCEHDDGEQPVESFAWYKTEKEAIAAALSAYPHAEVPE